MSTYNSLDLDDGLEPQLDVAIDMAGRDIRLSIDHGIPDEPDERADGKGHGHACRYLTIDQARSLAHALSEAAREARSRATGVRYNTGDTVTTPLQFTEPAAGQDQQP